MPPTAVRSGYIMNADNPLNYLEWGRVGAPVLVFIHAIRSPAYLWRRVAEGLEDRYRCVAINLSGHGDSGPYPVREYNPEVWVDDLKAFSQQLDLGPVTIVTFSVVAAGCAVEFAASYPERTRALVLIDGGAGYLEERVAEARTRMQGMPAEFPDWETALAFRLSMSDGATAPAGAWEERAPYIFRRLPDGKVVWKYDLLLQERWPGEDGFRNTGGHDLSVWERVQCPILVMKAHSPHLTPEDCDRIVQYGKGSRWVEVPSQTHFVFDENVEGLLERMEPFLDEVHRP
jgi:pimeloyl-ACP methyl ester carboxylesterase